MTYLNWNQLYCVIRVVFDEFHYTLYATTFIGIQQGYSLNVCGYAFSLYRYNNNATAHRYMC